MKKGPLFLLGALLIGALTLLWWKGPIPQDAAYHQFADRRSIAGIPNFWNVMSNLPMFFLGLYGFAIVLPNFHNRPDFAAKWMPVVLVFGIFITSFGSAYYHFAPDNQTLVWDRMPMTLMFMPLFSLLIYDFVDRNWGKWAFVILVPLGILSIVYWQITELRHAGDLRPYALVQFFPMLAGPIILLSSSKKTEYSSYFWWIIGWYIAAKIFEDKDIATYSLTGNICSGHTIKHFLGAVSLWYLIKLIQTWDRTFK